MEKKVSLSLILLTIFVCSFAQIHKDITVAQADSLIAANAANPDFNILDVRTSGEYSGGHLQSAVNIDYNSPTFGTQLNALDKNDIYLVYCKSSARSTQAVGTMKTLGFTETYNMLGGISAWISAGYQTVTGIKYFDEVSIQADMYPNPASDFVTVVMQSNSYPDVIMNIYNITGTLVKTELLKHSSHQIHISDLSNGIYVVEFKSGGVTGIQKLIIKR